MISAVIRYSSGFLVLWFLTHSAFIVIDGLTDEGQKADVGVIFGNTVYPDGTLSRRLQQRLDKGVQLFRDSLVSRLIVSGGLGKEGHYEGTRMFEYLVSKGVPSGKIIVDNDGNTTAATAANVARLNLKPKSIIVITQYHHISRAKLAFRRRGFEHVTGAHAEFFEVRDLYSIVREFPGYYKYLFID